MKEELDYLKHSLNYYNSDYNNIKKSTQPLVTVEFIQSRYTGDYYVRVYSDFKVRYVNDFRNYELANKEYKRWVML